MWQNGKAKLYIAVIQQDVQVAMCGRFGENGGRSRPVKQGTAAGTYSGGRLVKEVFHLIISGSFEPPVRTVIFNICF